MANYILSSLNRSESLRVLDARADDTDAEDYIFQPKLAQLPKAVDHFGCARILDQGNEGACVGFALATVVNVGLNLNYAALLARLRPKEKPKPEKPKPVSHRMLYEMGKRYDEWGGEHYEGTSLRGAMKGWHKHGVASATLWPYYSDDRKKTPDCDFNPERAADAMTRPIGAYYRIVDSDVSHVQAAIVEGDAVLASAWIHPGWHDENLDSRGRGRRKFIHPRTGKLGLHAFAIVGYMPEGFVIQNSWGTTWGSQGLAILSYDDWFENRQDAWVARPGPETRDHKGDPHIYVVGFGGGASPKASRAETSVNGLDLDSRLLPRLINTGDRGALSAGGRLQTRPEELPSMARQVLSSKTLRDGYHHVVLYAHGGLNDETYAARTAARLWSACEERELHSYFFIWESGKGESVLGWLKSDDDVTGPTRFSWSNAWENIQRGARKRVREAQKAVGVGLAKVVREVFWDEMKERATRASTPTGGASRFAKELFNAMHAIPGERYKIHLVGHSAGSIYHAWLYENALKNLFAKSPNVELGSIQFMAPAIDRDNAVRLLRNTGLKQKDFRVYMLKPSDEENDNIAIYPSSLLTYVADKLEDPNKRVPVFGIRKDFDGKVNFATGITASVSRRHGEFDDAGHEIEMIFDRIAAK
jgi:hypothetical protein